MVKKSSAPEFASVEAFVQSRVDDEAETFTHQDIKDIAFHLRRANFHAIRLELEGYGLRLEIRGHEKRVRGFTTSSNDRWYGPGSCPTHGGSGFSNKE